MIRVLHFADIINRNDFIHTVLEACDPQRFQMMAATLSDRGSLNRDPGRIPVVNFRARLPSAALRAVVGLHKLIRCEHIHILHAHHYSPALIGMLACLRLPVVFVMGRHYSDAIYRLARGVRRRLYLGLETACNRQAAAIVVPAVAVESVLLRQGVSPEKIVRIPYGFAFERYNPPADLADALRLWGPEPGLRLATFARLHPEKGHVYMVEALSLLAVVGIRATWLIAGDGPSRSSLEALVGARGLADRVRFLGWRTDVLALMAAAQAVVQPTLHEAFSQVMVEAMALGRPLVISDVSGVRDVVKDGESGLIVPPGDPAALAHALRRVMNPQEANRLGANARQTVRRTLAINAIAPRIEALYQGIWERQKV